MFDDLYNNNDLNNDEIDKDQLINDLEKELKYREQQLRDIHQDLIDTDRKLEKYIRWTRVTDQFSKKVEKELGKEQFKKLCDETIKDFNQEEEEIKVRALDGV